MKLVEIIIDWEMMTISGNVMDGSVYVVEVKVDQRIKIEVRKQERFQLGSWRESAE